MTEFLRHVFSSTIPLIFLFINEYIGVYIYIYIYILGVGID